MNETTSTMTDSVTLTKPVGQWFTDLSADVQAEITYLVNDEGYPLSDIREFIEQYGVEAYSDGHYMTWCELTERSGADTEAVEAFVDEFGIQNLESFEDAYRGEYDSEEDFAQQYFDNMYSSVGQLEGVGLVVDWQATWDTNLRYDFSYNNGYVFRSDF